MRRTAIAATLAAAASAAAFAPSAPAADPPPTPDCHGVSAVDKAGDSANTTTGETGSPSADLIGGFITYDGTKAKANIQVDNLTVGEVDDPYVAISWEMAFTTSDGPRYVRAYQDRTGIVKYNWAEPRAITDDQTAPRASGDTTGALFPGKGGIVSIDIPLADIGAKPGTQFKAIALEVRQWVSLPASVPNTGLPLYSYAPIFDEASGKGAVDVKACAPGQTAPTATTPTTTPPAAAAPPQSGTAKLAVSAKVPRLVARKLRSRSFTVRLKGNATAIKAALLTKAGSSGKKVGAGSMKALKRSGKLKIKLKRKLKKGRYVLVMTGRNADGQAGERSVTVRVR